MSKSLNVVSVVGARPQFVKLAPVARACACCCESGANIEHTIVHTGQHYDDNMSKVFFDELEIPKPNINLAVSQSVGSAGGHAAQTGRMMEQLEGFFLKHCPDVVLVYGDTNSTLAASLAASKIHVPVAHIEAGLRSFNRRMPEEINRVATDHCSDRLYVPTPAGMENLQKENLADRAVLCGDVMHDAVKHSIALAEARDIAPVSLSSGYGLLTLHRASNTEPEVLLPLLNLIDALAQKFLPIIFPVHPRTRSIIESSDIQLSSAIQLIDPLPYLYMLQTVKAASAVLTDSGGLQKEAAFLGTQCVTLRDETEWTETLGSGVNRLTGIDPVKIERALSDLVDCNFSFDPEASAVLDKAFGDGTAASKIVVDVLEYFS